jgi:CARDB/Bacterial Ig-like domain (group 2)
MKSFFNKKILIICFLGLFGTLFSIGFAQTASANMGNWEKRATNTVYTAETDGFALATFIEGGDEICKVKIQTPIGTTRQYANANHDGAQITETSPVRKGDQWTVVTESCGSTTVHWIPYTPPISIPATGTVIIKATKDDGTGAKDFDIPAFTANVTMPGSSGPTSGPMSLNPPDTFAAAPVGAYTVTGVDFNTLPAGITYRNTTYSPSQTLSANGTITVTINFVSAPSQPSTGTIQVRATKTENGITAPWSTSFTANMTMPGSPASDMDVTAPFDFPGSLAGTYTVNGLPKLPAGVTLSSITPSQSQTLAANGTITFTANFVTTVVPPAVPTLKVTPSPASVNVNGTQPFYAIYDQDGSGGVYYPTYVTAAWSSSDNSIAPIIYSTGVATGNSAGTVTITASYLGLPATAPLTVKAPVLTPTLTIIPDYFPMAIGGTKLFRADYDPDGSGPQPLQTGVSATWSSVNMAKVTINNGGLAARVGHGDTSIIATYLGLSAPATVPDPAVLAVRPTPNNLDVGGWVQIDAYLDPDGPGSMSEVTTPVTTSSSWSSNRAFAVLDTSVIGKVTAVSAGSNARITANYQGIIGKAFVNVASSPQPDLRISVMPSLNSGSLTAGSILTFKGTVKNFGNAVAGGTFYNQFKIDGLTIPTDPTITALAVSASFPVVSGTWVATAGSHTIQLCADSTSLVTESNEGNNCATGATFTVAAYPPPSITSFTAMPDSINKGDPSTLTWFSSNTLSCAALAGAGFSTGNAKNGTDEVQPQITTDYTIDCTGLDGLTHVYRTVMVTVIPVTTSIKASPSCINGGGSSKISWSATPATLLCNVSSVPASPLGPAGPGISSTQLVGSQKVTVSAKTTYKIACGTAIPSKSVIVDVSSCWSEF